MGDSAVRGGRWPAPLRVLAGCLLGGGLIAGQLERERARWFVWLPVAFGIGIAAYFSLMTEPDTWMALAVPLISGGLLAAGPASGILRLAISVLFAASLGFAAAKVRTEMTRAPVLARDLPRADIQGMVEMIEPRAARGERLTIRVTAIAGLAPEARPAVVRVRTMTSHPDLKPGDSVRLIATLRPPAIPALPGGYDFARWAWFQGIGATGFAVQAPKIVATADKGSLQQRARAALQRLRRAIGERVTTALPGETGAIAVSLITGERGAITDATNDAYRDSGLVHILSISGLHMAIMAGAVFLSLRLLLAAVPAVALRYPIKKWAAGAALVGGFCYLLISGGSIATLRAFVMVTIMFVAVMLDRQAIAMRNVAIAALVVLLLMPESLLDAGFQMSFAAVVALISAYEAVRARAETQGRSVLRSVAFFFGGIVASTIIASLAVAPFGIFHFQVSQQYALIANLIALPICDLVVMPGALMALVLMPFGLEPLALWAMGLGIDLMTATAYWVASLPGAVLHVPEIPAASFGFLIAGGLWLTLWQTRWRLLGVAAIGAGLALAGGGERPDILAGRGGALVAARGPDGRLAATGTRSGNFDLSRWLQHDGDGRRPREALRGRLFRCDGTGCVGETKGTRVAVSRHAAALAEDCRRSPVVITELRPPPGCAPALALIDRRALLRNGAHAIRLVRDDDGTIRAAHIETVRDRRGTRPWTQPPAQLRPQVSGRASR
ncbi:ComEC/Rec2 family competence protein [Hyphomicrobium sp.]|uniref:ComEC/Rec2 family competence protein n=1 Tax=Hyphomicrobium sp. TaxID=82 RepID=UPI002FDD902A